MYLTWQNGVIWKRLLLHVQTKHVIQIMLGTTADNNHLSCDGVSIATKPIDAAGAPGHTASEACLTASPAAAGDAAAAVVTG